MNVALLLVSMVQPVRMPLTIIFAAVLHFTLDFTVRELSIFAYPIHVKILDHALDTLGAIVVSVILVSRQPIVKLKLMSVCLTLVNMATVLMVLICISALVSQAILDLCVKQILMIAIHCLVLTMQHVLTLWMIFSVSVQMGTQDMTVG
jgi:hypothetical protein